MATEKQIAAARANGARSRGPKTPEGKARSSRNSARSGTLAHALLLKGESREGLESVVGLLNRSLQPQDPFEALLIEKMAAAHWRQLRIWNREQQGDSTLTPLEMRCDLQFLRIFDRYLRYKSFPNRTNPLTPAPATHPSPNEPENEPDRTACEPHPTAFGPADVANEPDLFTRNTK
jgi:hypothetical protein